MSRRDDSLDQFSWEREVRDWVDRAACRGAGPAEFFRTPPAYRPRHKPKKAPTELYAVALKCCARCPVRSECLEYATATKQHYGVWGGQIFN